MHSTPGMESCRSWHWLRWTRRSLWIPSHSGCSVMAVCPQYFSSARGASFSCSLLAVARSTGSTGLSLAGLGRRCQEQVRNAGYRRAWRCWDAHGACHVFLTSSHTVRQEVIYGNFLLFAYRLWSSVVQSTLRTPFKCLFRSKRGCVIAVVWHQAVWCCFH